MFYPTNSSLLAGAYSLPPLPSKHTIRALVIAFSLLLVAGHAFSQTTAANILPANAGQNLGNTDQRWNAYVQNLDVSGTVNGSGSLGAFTPGSGILGNTLPYTSIQTFSGGLSTTNISATSATINAINGEVNAARVAASDICAAVAAQPQGTAVYIPAGNYTCTNTMTLPAYVSVRAPAGPQQTNINYTGSGIAVNTTGGNTVSGISLTVGSNATDGFKIRGENVLLRDFYIQGGGSTTKMIHVAAFDGSNLSGVDQIINGYGFGINGIGIYADHVTDLYLTNIDLYFTNGNTTTGMVVDTGVSGLYASGVSVGGATQGGLVVKNTTPGAGTYNAQPGNLFFNNSIFDCALNACSTADAVLFDSSLSTNAIYATFSNSWAAGYGHNGFHLSGGQGISILNGTKIRSNYLNGVLIDSANVSNVNVAGNFITSNNVSNNGDAHGVYVSAAATHVSIANNLIANALDSGGHQKYGIKIAAVLADQFRAVGNDLYPNDTAYLSNGSTGAYNIIANNSDPSNSASSSSLSGDLIAGGNLFANVGMSAPNIIATTKLQLGSQATSTVTQTEIKLATAGCATAASAGAACITTITLPASFADTGYAPNCNGIGATSGVPVLGAISKSTTQITVTTVAATAAAAQFTTVDCAPVHP